MKLVLTTEAREAAKAKAETWNRCDPLTDIPAEAAVQIAQAALEAAQRHDPFKVTEAVALLRRMAPTLSHEGRRGALWSASALEATSAFAAEPQNGAFIEYRRGQTIHITTRQDEASWSGTFIIK